MLKVGITGGIGSGKTVVCQVFYTLGIPVFYADEAARYLMEHDAVLINNIRRLLGEDVYAGGKPDRAKISSLVYGNAGLLQRLNALVHPATIKYGREWMDRQSSPYVIKEAAIFFESNSYHDMDIMVGVHAPEALRISRAMSRSNLSRQKVLAIMDEQMDEQEKMKRCDHVIVNDDKSAILPQILALDRIFRAKIR